MQSVVRVARWIVRRLAAFLVVGVVLAARFWRRRRDGRGRRQADRSILPSLYDVHPAAGTAPRRSIGLRPVPVDDIVGTTRQPSQNTADFLPLPRLRGANWRARWQRINRAVDRLAMLPPVDLVQVGDKYWVTDGHNRVAAARKAGAAEIDADVTQILLPGVTAPGQARMDASSLVGSDEVRQAGSGRLSRTAEHRPAVEEVSRQDLLRDTGRPE